MQVGKKYRILSVIVEDDATAKPKKNIYACNTT